VRRIADNRRKNVVGVNKQFSVPGSQFSVATEHFERPGYRELGTENYL
jgi:hypothetical protein